jgi:RimJ/RimL family protein N-acetyltransferase
MEAEQRRHLGRRLRRRVKVQPLRAADPRIHQGATGDRGPHEGQFIGYCGLIVGRATWGKPESAFELFRSHHGHGYAAEAGEAVVTAAIRSGWERLVNGPGLESAIAARIGEAAIRAC